MISVGNCNFLLIKYNYPDTLYLSEKYGVSHWISIITFLNNNVYLTFFNFSVWLFSGCLPIENWRIFVYLQVNHLNVHLRNNETQVSSPIHGALRVQGKNNTCFSAVFRYTSIETVLDLENWILDTIVLIVHFHHGLDCNIVKDIEPLSVVAVHYKYRYWIHV